MLVRKENYFIITNKKADNDLEKKQKSFLLNNKISIL